ncbi:carboxypeptidase regulatory-like domain-containing protein [Nakamurella alba]|uniref:carboxypeptidase regulatory-like domain-containing protein n=1 Tax=Nakamurella alba TaxID=2665158 RepID=UPI0018AA031A|nr:carboxypeptidase regulatory-like domain-containing protein [Nakamurella alba]
MIPGLVTPCTGTWYNISAIPSATGFVPGCGQEVQATSGRTTTAARIRLEVGGSITGTIRDTRGQPLAGIQVFAESDSDFRTGRTAADGTYALRGLLGGTYTVCARNDGNATGGRSAAGWVERCRATEPGTDPARDKVVVERGTVTAGADLSLPFGAAIEGRVTNDRGLGLGLVDVQVIGFGSSGTVLTFVTTDQDGRYRIDNLPAGQLAVCFDNDRRREELDLRDSGALDACWKNVNGEFVEGTVTPVTTVAGRTTSGISPVLRTGGAVAGKVTTPGGDPMGLVGVLATDVTGKQVHSLTGPDGRYQFIGLTPGAATICFDPPGISGSKCWKDVEVDGTPTPVTVTAGVVTRNISAVLDAD